MDSFFFSHNVGKEMKKLTNLSSVLIMPFAQFKTENINLLPVVLTTNNLGQCSKYQKKMPHVLLTEL